MDDLGDIHPILTIVGRTERATMRAAREMARRQAERDPANVAPLDDGLALTSAGLERLTACHRTSYRKADWRVLAERELVVLPVRTRELEKAARRALATWQPRWQDRMFGDEAMRRRQLAARVMDAAREDESAYLKAHRAAQAHNAETLLARGLLELQPAAIKDAVATKTRLSETGQPMNTLGVALPGARRVVAVVEVLQEGDIPYERVEGDRLRRTPIPPSERRRIHLAAVCSAGLRVGADLAAILPVEAVEVVVTCEPPGASRTEPRPVMQVLVTTAALSEQPWAKADAITLATALGARLDWSIEQGFAPIRLVALSRPRQTATAGA